jgi:hypothetical protein
MDENPGSMLARSESREEVCACTLLHDRATTAVTPAGSIPTGLLLKMTLGVIIMYCNFTLHNKSFIMAELPPDITEKVEQLKDGGLQAFMLRLINNQANELNYLFDKGPTARGESPASRALRYQVWFDALQFDDQAALAASLSTLFPHLSFEAIGSDERKMGFAAAYDLIIAKNEGDSLIEELDRLGWIDASLIAVGASPAQKADELATIIRSQRPELLAMWQSGKAIGKAPVSVKIKPGSKNYLYILKYLRPSQFSKVVSKLTGRLSGLHMKLSDSSAVAQSSNVLHLLKALPEYDGWEALLITAIEEAQREDATVTDTSWGSRRSLQDVLGSL